MPNAASRPGSSPPLSLLSHRPGSGGGEPYKAVDGDTYYSKNGRAYRQETNERVGFFASKVRFKLRMRPSGVYCTQAECDMPAALLLPDHQRPADYDAEQKFETAW